MEIFIEQSLSLADFLLILQLCVGGLFFVGFVAPVVQKPPGTLQHLVRQLLCRHRSQAWIVISCAFGKARREIVERSPFCCNFSRTERLCHYRISLPTKRDQCCR